LILRVAQRCAFVAFLIPILADAAVAESRGTDQQRNACMGDAFRFCLSSIPNSRRIETCLRANRRSLSAACHQEIFDDTPAPAQKVMKRVVQDHAPD
jgi:hypothetical protein